jgi:antagonist of KipI
MASLTVMRAGMLTTVQDLGSWGLQHLGVPVAGPMDWYSHRLANRRVGNAGDAAALEMTLLGPELIAEGDLLCAVAGASVDVIVGDDAMAAAGTFTVPHGKRLRFTFRRPGARATLAVRGGIDVTPVLGSRATSLISRVGPFGGRALAVGDVLHIGAAPISGGAEGLPLPLETGGARIRVMPGPHADRFTEESLRLFSSCRYTVSPASNRMGFRLEGAVLAKAMSGQTEMLSDATPIGSIQVPPSGQPILLMADRQTTGGYPKIATVITADLPVAGQLAPGDWIEFVPVTRPAALDALRHRVAALSRTQA